MKKTSKIISAVIKKNIQKEMDSACAIFGFQPRVPDSAKKFKDIKKK
ncbi:MAG: cyclic lactone autoinducer peptide [Lachnospiraceae bacterium]|nr:cyclic lactone autoinducer peptide [Lachnospiraceae bacterium]